MTPAPGMPRASQVHPAETGPGGPPLRRPLRVLQVIESLSRGGAERRLVNDLTYLPPEGVESSVVHVLPPDDLRPDVEALGVNVEWLGVSGASDLPAGVLRLRRIIRRYRPDIVHTHLFFADLCGRMAAWWAGSRPVMATLQNTMYEPECAEFYSSNGRFWIDRLTARRICSHAVAVSAQVKRSAVQRLRLREEQLTVIHNHVDTAKFAARGPELRRAVRAALGVAEADFVLVSAGRFVPPKGLPVVIHALAPLLHLVPKARLILAGGGPEEGDLRALVRSENLEDRVIFVGVREDPHRLFQGADVFLFPSLACEGFPLAPLEAMAVGLPVVASRMEPMEELIEEGVSGLLFAPGDSKALAAAVGSLARDESRRRSIAEAGRRRVHERFSAKQGARLLADCYRRVWDRCARGSH